MTFREYDRFGKPKRRISRVFIHCSAHDGKHTDDAEIIDRWHKDRGWSGIGYHYFIQFDGTIQVGQPINKIPAAQRYHNRGSIAICLHGGQNSKPGAFTEAQFDSLRRICRDIDEAYSGKVTFHGHREVAAKACPVFDYKEILGLDAKGYLRKGVVNAKKLENAGSKTIKSTETGKDISVGTGAVGVLALLGKAKEYLKSWGDYFGEWRGVIDPVVDVLGWLGDNLGVVVVGLGVAVFYYFNRIEKARIADEGKIGRLENAASD